MKRAAFVLMLLVAFAAAPLYAIRITSVDDVIRLHRSGVGTEELLALLARPHDPFDVTAVDVIAMQEAGLPQAVIDAVVAGARPPAVKVPAETPPVDRPVETGDSSGERGEDVEEEECVTFDPPWGAFFWPPWLWDPHWYMPRLHSVVNEPAGRAPANSRADAITTKPGRETTSATPPRSATPARPEQSRPRSATPPREAPQRFPSPIG